MTLLSIPASSDGTFTCLSLQGRNGSIKPARCSIIIRAWESSASKSIENSNAEFHLPRRPGRLSGVRATVANWEAAQITPARAFNLTDPRESASGEVSMQTQSRLVLTTADA